MMMTGHLGLVMALTAVTVSAAGDAAIDRFELREIFELELATDPQISPDGSQVAYVRAFMDVMKDRRLGNLWLVSSDGARHRPLTTGPNSYGSPRWSPSGDRLAFTSGQDGSTQIYVRYMDDGQTGRLTQLTQSPSGLAWSPDGDWLAFSMFVPSSPEPFVELPSKPAGAEWAEPPTVIEKLRYRADGAGYLDDGYNQLFLVSAEGGTPRQLTEGDFNHGGQLSWTPDGSEIVFSANRHDGGEYDPANSEVYSISVATGEITQLTDRQGPDSSPTVSPDGKHIAYTGFDDRYQGYQITALYLMDRDGQNARVVTDELDRDVNQATWRADSRGLFFRYDDEGNTKLAFVDLKGKVETLVGGLGGLSLGRPYAGSSFSASRNGVLAYTYSTPMRPADVGVVRPGDAEGSRLTDLNADLFDHKTLAEIEEIWFESSHDGRKIQGWIAKPPGFDPSGKYPLILEIHGGPFANYGDRFASEIQLYAAAGYVVLYINPRGSTSYGREFGNLIHHNYPGEDYDDLMSGVDAVIERGYVDSERLYVTGGSGGGVLTAWIVGKTNRFRAAVVAKPVINWYSFVLTADSYPFFYKYWFPGFPWDEQEHYMARSPLSLVGNVETPTMLLTGEADHRTPISETEQYYQALKLRKIETAMVRVPGASHGIANRPSHLIAKVAYILEWFDRHQPEGE